MKKILKYLTMFFAVVVFSIGMSSCTKDDSPTTGSVKVINHTGYSIHVDVTWGNNYYNDERVLSNNYYTTYNDVPNGTVKVWG